MLVTLNFLHFTIFWFLWFCIQCLIMLCAFRIIVCESRIILKYCHWNGFCGFCFFVFSDAMWALISNSFEFFFKIFSTSILFTKIHKPLSFPLPLPLRLRLSCCTRVLQQIYVMDYSSLISSNKEVLLHFIFSPHKFEIFPVSFHPNTWDFHQVLFHFTTNLRFLSSFFFLWPQVYSINWRHLA